MESQEKERKEKYTKGIMHGQITQTMKKIVGLKPDFLILKININLFLNKHQKNL